MGDFPEPPSDVEAKRYGRLAGWILWPLCTVLGFSMVGGILSPGIEAAYVTFLWIVVGLMLVLALSSLWVIPSLLKKRLPRPGGTPTPGIYRTMQIVTALVVGISLVIADRPILGGCLILSAAVMEFVRRLSWRYYLKSQKQATH